MKKWTPAVLVVLLLATLSVSLTLYFNDQNLNRELTTLKRQRNQDISERNRQATVSTSQRTDLASTIEGQKSEIERIQKVLQSQQDQARALAQRAGAGSLANSTTTTGDSASADLYQGGLDAMRQNLTDLRSMVDKLKEYAARLEKNLNVPAPNFDTSAAGTTLAPSTSIGISTTTAPASTGSIPPSTVAAPIPSPTPLALEQHFTRVSESENPASQQTMSAQLILLSQDLSQLSNDLQTLLQRYNRLETAALSVAQNNNSLNNSNSVVNNSNDGPGISGAIAGPEAEKLAASSYAPKGWPVNGAITSPFGPRPAIFASVPKTVGGNNTTLTDNNNQKTGKGGDATPTPTPFDGPKVAKGINPTPTVVNPATVEASPSPTATTTITPTLTVTAAPTKIAASPTISPTANPTTAITTPTVSPSATPTITATRTVSPTITTTPSGPDLKLPGISTSGFNVPAGWEFHTGLDIGVIEGTQVRATASGVVEYAGEQRSGYGKVVYIEHPGGFVTIYGHNSRLLVVPGQAVQAGDVIALSGNTGYSTGPHVHYEIRYKSQVVDPAPFTR